MVHSVMHVALHIMQQPSGIVHYAQHRIVPLEKQPMASVMVMSIQLVQLVMMLSRNHAAFRLTVFGQIRTFVLRRVAQQVLVVQNIHISLVRHSFIHIISRYRNHIEDLK